jgi:Flp pilus assembly protein TadD
MKPVLWTMLLLASVALGCAASNESLEKDNAVFNDERANPYRFNRSVAYTLLRTGQPMEASRVIRRMIDLDADQAEAYYMLGLAYLDMREFESSERALRAALRMDGDFARAYSMLGVLLDHLRRHPEAEREHKRAVALAPKDAGFRNNLGFSYYLRGDYRSAVTAYRAALELDAAARRIHNNLGFAHGKLGELDKAEEQFKLAGPPAQGWNNLGYLHEEAGKHELAYQYYMIAVQQDPLLIAARESLARVCRRLGRPVPDVKVDSTLAEEALAPPEVSLSSPKTEPQGATP